LLQFTKTSSATLQNFFKSVVNRKEPEPQSVISDPATVGSLISAPRLPAPAPQHFFPSFLYVIAFPLFLTIRSKVRFFITGTYSRQTTTSEGRTLLFRYWNILTKSLKGVSNICIKYCVNLALKSVLFTGAQRSAGGKGTHYGAPGEQRFRKMIKKKISSLHFLLFLWDIFDFLDPYPQLYPDPDPRTQLSPSPIRIRI
jgi:hypothetical protein